MPSPDDYVWIASQAEAESSNAYALMKRVGAACYEQLHSWSTENRGDYWQAAIETLGIRFQRSWTEVLDVSGGAENARWLVGAQWNITDSCFRAEADSPAIVEPDGQGGLKRTSVAELESLSRKIAASLQQQGIRKGDAVAIIMPMHSLAVAAYLAILRCGASAVGIAESFTAPEIATRLRLSNTRLILVQDSLQRAAKRHPLYERIEAVEIPAIVVGGSESTVLRPGDLAWSEFLRGDGELSDTMPAPTPLSAEDSLGILFSSGTTGEPKTIPWTNLCPLKCAADGHFHQDIRPGDVVAWPTSLGWMMGPWLIFASLLNRASMALYDGPPTEAGFATFIENAQVTMLGLVPSLVSAWREKDLLANVDWSRIRLFSSTGECSNESDMAWLMNQGGKRRPVIEYCGGTELAGGYITSSILRPCRAATFNTPTLGLDFVVLDENEKQADQGELFITPPSIGMSSQLLHQDHHAVYYADCPQLAGDIALRRHGDEMERLADGYYRAHGRVDDTMNLGGVKVSSAEIERAMAEVDGVRELAAVAETPPGGGPSRLVVYAALEENQNDIGELQRRLQLAIREQLNPLFKIHELVIVERLPRTASNKIMRRQLRKSLPSQ